MVVVTVFIFILEYLRAVVQAVGGGFLVNKVLTPCLTAFAVVQQVGNLAALERAFFFFGYACQSAIFVITVFVAALCRCTAQGLRGAVAVVQVQSAVVRANHAASIGCAAYIAGIAKVVAGVKVATIIANHAANFACAGNGCFVDYIFQFTYAVANHTADILAAFDFTGHFDICNCAALAQIANQTGIVSTFLRHGLDRNGVAVAVQRAFKGAA